MKNKTEIYSLTDPITLQVRYIGKTTIGIKNRFKNHLITKESNYKTNWISSLKNQGLIPILELVDVVDSKDWKFWEKHYISLYKSWGFKLTNLTNGGDGFEPGHIVSEETKTKISKKLKLYKFPQSRKNNISKSLKGRKLSKAHIEKQIKNREKEVLQLSKTGELIKTWESCTKAASELKIDRSTIAKCARGNTKYKSTGNFKWSYK